LKTAAKPLHMETCMVTIGGLKMEKSSPCPTAPSPTSYDLPFSHDTAQLAEQIAYDSSKSSNVNDFRVT